MTVMEKLERNGIRVDLPQLWATARRYHVRELSVFGSALRDDLRGDSDVDVLVSFQPGEEVSLFDLIDLEAELSRVFCRRVDLVEVESLTNPIRRRTILASRECLYAA